MTPDHDRPPETDVSRLRWLLGDGEMSQLGLIADPNETPPPRIVQTVLNLVARLTGSIWFYYYDEKGKRRVFVGRP